MQKELILSSSSSARRALLARLKIPFKSVSPDIDETKLNHETIEEMILRLAISKAQKVSQEFPDALIIGCDQVGILENEILTKPITYEKAVAQLRMMSKKMIRFKTALCLYDAKINEIQTTIVDSDVYMRALKEEDIHYYLTHENALQCAGSCQVEGLGITLIEKLQTNDYTALIGLPLIALTSMLKTRHFNFFS